MKNRSAKNSSTSCAKTEPRRAAGVAFLALLALAAMAAAKKPTDPDELFNPLLGVRYSHWLVGPMVRIASEEEVEGYLALTTDAEAAAFIQELWDRRNAGTAVFKETPQQLFEKRSAEADKRFTEAAYSGSRTDRGTILILYGEPETISFDTGQKVGDPTLEVWKYPKDAAPGLDAKPPKRQYRFIKLGELTVFYEGKNTVRRPQVGNPTGFQGRPK